MLDANLKKKKTLVTNTGWVQTNKITNTQHRISQLIFIDNFAVETKIE